jgi:hypothetical protein
MVEHFSGSKLVGSPSQRWVSKKIPRRDFSAGAVDVNGVNVPQVGGSMRTPTSSSASRAAATRTGFASVELAGLHMPPAVEIRGGVAPLG